MNVLIIPSWYPSKDHPHTGIFNKEQAVALSSVFPGSNFAISTWGSHEEDLLLWKENYFKNLKKVVKYFSKSPLEVSISTNLTEYYNPAFTWSRKILDGNINRIIKASEKHFLKFRSEKREINVIHAHSAYPGGWIAMVLGKKYHLPYVITEHMTPFPFQSFLEKDGNLSPYLRKPLFSSACNIVVSPQQLKNLREWDIPRLKYIPNLTNEDYFRPSSSGIPKQNKFSFFTLGNLISQKGISILLQSINLLVKRDKEVRFKIGGEGIEKIEYQKIAKELGITNYIEWLGRLSREDAVREFQGCDAFVLPSLHENLPLVLLEAIACGKPVISTRCGGPESIINEKNGILAEPGDSISLYSALEYIKDNIHKYDETEIRAGFLKRYSRKVVCEQIMEVYKQVTEEFR